MPRPEPNARIGAPSGALLEALPPETRWQEADWFRQWEELARRDYQGVIFNEGDPRHPRYAFERGRPHSHS